MAHLVADLRYALRSLRKVPLFTAIAVLSMAFGIAANTAVFTLVDQVVLRTLPVVRPGEAGAGERPGYGNLRRRHGRRHRAAGYAMYKDLRDHNAVFAGMFCRMQTGLTVTAGGRSELVSSELVSGSFFPQLGVRPAIWSSVHGRRGQDRRRPSVRGARLQLLDVPLCRRPRRRRPLDYGQRPSARSRRRRGRAL